jgi:RimJ/RimL family protein N-acetyltransferase
VSASGIRLRWPSADDLAALAALAAGEPYDPAVAPLALAGPDASPAERGRGVLQYHWRNWGGWTPSDWSLDLIADAGGVIVGSQMLSGRDFAVCREVTTGSWLGREYRGKGIGTVMRVAILCLAFDGLGADSATSGAAEDNAASAGVSRKLGYSADGVDRVVAAGKVLVMRRFRLDRAAWQARRALDVEIDGLAACRADFGIG